MLTEDVCRIGITSYVVKVHNPRSNAPSSLVEGKSVVSLVELSVRYRGCVDYSLVVPKHVAWSFDWDSKVSQGIAKVNDLLCAGSGSDVLRTKSSRFHGRL